MSDVVGFNRARLDEDEATAKAADPDLGHLRGWVELSEPSTRADEAHALRHNPERVLREVEAIRAIVDDYAETREMLTKVESQRWPDDEWLEHMKVKTEVLEGIMTGIAGIWRDHPGYSPDW